MAVLVIVDAQREYVTPGRPFFLETIATSLNNIHTLLDHARARDWKIVHMRHVQNSECFTYGSPFAEFIDGLGPQGEETSLEKSNFSCFSSREFQALIDKYRHEDIFLAGYGASMCCLSTLIDAHHRGHEFTFVTDATCSKATHRFGEQDMTEHIVDLASAFGNTATTDEVLKREVK